MQLNALHVGAKCNLRLVAPQLNANFQHTHTVKTKEKHTYTHKSFMVGGGGKPIESISIVGFQCNALIKMRTHTYLCTYICTCVLSSQLSSTHFGKTWTISWNS